MSADKVTNTVSQRASTLPSAALKGYAFVSWWEKTAALDSDQLTAISMLGESIKMQSHWRSTGDETLSRPETSGDQPEEDAGYKALRGRGTGPRSAFNISSLVLERSVHGICR
jgi:hypothetical protein